MTFNELIWCNGEVIAADQFRISVRDPALLFGLGLFETTRTWDGVPWFWDRHLLRLRKSASSLGLDLCRVRLPNEATIQRFAAMFGDGDRVVRLNVSMGTEADPPVAWMVTRPLPAPVPHHALQACPWRISRSDPLASIKCFNYGTRVLAHQRALRSGCEGALLISTDNLVLDTTYANLFVRVAGRWRTPPLDGGVLPGTVRQLLLEHQPIPIAEEPLNLTEVDSVEAAFLTNSTAGAIPVARLGELVMAVPSVPSEVHALLAIR